MNGWTQDELGSPSGGSLIRVKKLKDLIETSTSGDENEREPADQEEKSSNASPLDSPPDSGIHGTGSECHDDERQQAVVPGAVGIASSAAKQVSEAPCNYIGSNTQAPSSSSGTIKVTNMSNPPKRKLPCSLCNKKFNNVSSLNFHTKKFHPGDVPEKDVSPNKVILTIQRDITGNFSSKHGSKSEEPETHLVDEDNSEAQQQTRTRKRSLSSSSDSTKVTSTSQTKESGSLKSRLRRSRENSETDNKKQKKSSYYHDSEYKQPGSSSTNWRKFIVPDDEESENESVSDASEATTPAVKKTNVGRKKTRQSNIQDSPIAKNTRTRAAKRSRILSPSPSGSENESSTSEPEISDKEESDSGESDNDVEELTEKSTTSVESLTPPSLTDYGSEDDLFTPIITKRNKKKATKENQDCDNKDNEEETSVKGSGAGSEVSSKNSKVTSKQQESSLYCSHCSIQYKDASSFIQHLYKAHKGKEMKFNCGYCEKRFSTADDISVFNKHVITHKKKNKKK